MCERRSFLAALLAMFLPTLFAQDTPKKFRITGGITKDGWQYGWLVYANHKITGE